MFDGVVNEEGLIIMATANSIDDIDPAIYREGRMSLVEFTKSRRIDVQNIVEQMYQTKLSPEQIDQLPDNTLTQPK